MHHIDSLLPAVRSNVRSMIFRVLRDYATGGQYSIYFGTIFLKVADLLAEQSIINRIETNSGRMSYISLRADHHSDWFPNYNMPLEIAKLIRQTFWELFLQGVLAPSSFTRGNDKNLFHLDLDSCDITPYGVQVLISSDDRIQ